MDNNTNTVSQQLLMVLTFILACLSAALFVYDIATSALDRAPIMAVCAMINTAICVHNYRELGNKR